jgi:hypothetical protein
MRWFFKVLTCSQPIRLTDLKSFLPPALMIAPLLPSLSSICSRPKPRSGPKVPPPKWIEQSRHSRSLFGCQLLPGFTSQFREEHSFRSRWAFLGQIGLAREPGALHDVLGCGQGGLGIITVELQLHHIQRSVGLGFQPLAGLGPQLNNDMRISRKAIGKGKRSKGFLFSNSFHLGNERGN